MKRHVLGAALAFALHAASAHAQDVASPLTRADVWAGVGWHHAHLEEAGEYDDWYHRSASGTVSAGWYFTNHFKAELDLGATSHGRVYVFSGAFVDGDPAPRYGWITHSTRMLGVTGQYQFLDNAWFHPFLGAGLDVVREKEQEQLQPVVVFDRLTQRSRVVEPAREESSTHVLVRPAASMGFKAYMTRRAYFRTDARIRFSDRIEDVIVRFGLGVDF